MFPAVTYGYNKNAYVNEVRKGQIVRSRRLFYLATPLVEVKLEVGRYGNY